MGSNSASDSRPSGSRFSGLHTKLCAGLFSILVAPCLGGSLVVAADAQTPSPSTASAQFDGTYAFVSATKVNETRTRGPEVPTIVPCRDRKAGSLIVSNGQARLGVFDGTVGPHGELEMRHADFISSEPGMPGWERVIYGRIDVNGAVRAREISGGCNYDFIWQKETR
jgi:hypothetical protein